VAKFVYRMQNVLVLKQKLEEQEKIAYTLAANALKEEQNKLQELIVRRASYEKQLSDLMHGILDLKKISRCRNSIDAMRSLIREQLINVQKAEKALDEERKRLDSVMKDRKTHEKLREHAFERFKEELKAEEIKEIDELTSYTHSVTKEEG
jgi:flagellar FliJ protein